MKKISRLRRKAVSENESYTGDVEYVSGIVFPEGYDEVENNPITDEHYFSDAKVPWKFEEQTDYKTSDAYFGKTD